MFSLETFFHLNQNILWKKVIFRKFLEHYRTLCVNTFKHFMDQNTLLEAPMLGLCIVTLTRTHFMWENHDCLNGWAVLYQNYFFQHHFIRKGNFPDLPYEVWIHLRRRQKEKLSVQWWFYNVHIILVQGKMKEADPWISQSLTQNG